MLGLTCRDRPKLFPARDRMLSRRRHFHTTRFDSPLLVVPLLLLLASAVGLCLAAQISLPPASDGISPMGICWGMVSHRPVPAMPVVSMLEKNPYIARVKLFNADGVVLSALAMLGTTVEVMVMVRNGELQAISLSDSAADGWLYANILSTLPTGVNIKYISVGNEPYLLHPQPFDDYLVVAFNRLYQSLERAGLETQIKLVVSFNSEILGSSSNVPSNGTFVPKWVNQIRNMTSIMNATGSFFSVNIYPFFTYKDNNKIPLNFIMFGSDAKAVNDTGNGKAYYNIFDASFDAIVAALTRIGFPNLEIRIGEIGWPSDGNPNATLQLSQTFNQRSIQHLLSGSGTPMRPNIVIPFYIFGLFDEDAKAVRAGPFERRWGIYDDLAAPKYNLDLSGRGDPAATLPQIPGISKMRNSWCILSNQYSSNPNSDDAQATLNSVLGDVCGDDPSQGGDYSDAGDCTPVLYPMSSPGLRCQAVANISNSPLAYETTYALNAKFQAQGQNSNSCTYNGYGTVVYTDPSTSDCTFQIGLDIGAIDAYFNPSGKWSWEVFGWLVAMIAVLVMFL